MTNLVIKQGADLEVRIENVKDANGTLITNWSNYSVKVQIRERAESPTVLHEWSTASGNAAFSGSDIVLSLPNATSASWTWSRGRYDVELTNPTGKVARVAEGHVTVSREVTR